MSSIKETIRQEIERQLEYFKGKEDDAWDDCDKYTDEDAQWYQGHWKMCSKLLTFIDSLPEDASCVYDTNKFTPTPSVNIEDVARVQFASHVKVFDRKRKAVFDWEQFKEVAGIFYGFGKRDSLPEEKPSEDLEEAAKEYATTHLRNNEFPTADSAFIAGAEWQYQKDRGEFAKLKAKEWSDGYNEGIAKGKEQMTKDAVEGEVCGRVRDHINVRFADGVSIYLEPKNISHIPADISKYAVGDKVKIIIVKQ